ncbi:MAG: lipopolysaccharide heptosyltransferase II, partial [Candidatus Dadabacteria bacterium]
MKILLVQTSHPGDIVLSLPVISFLKEEKHPCTLDLLTTKEGEELLKWDPRINTIITYDKHNKEKSLKDLLKLSALLKKNNYTAAYSLHRSYRTALLLFFADIQERIGFKNSAFSFLYTKKVARLPFLPDIFRNLLIATDNFKKIANTEAKLYLKDAKNSDPSVQQYLNEKNLALIFPGSKWATKQWTLEGFAKTANWLKAQAGLKVVVAGGANEKSLCQAVAKKSRTECLANNVALDDLALLVSKAKLVVCNDSLPLHLASALKVPVVGIYCSTVPEFGFVPLNSPAVLVRKTGLYCQPCGRHGFKKCPINTHNCANLLSAKEVI